jgi:hypothetical protein
MKEAFFVGAYEAAHFAQGTTRKTVISEILKTAFTISSESLHYY